LAYIKTNWKDRVVEKPLTFNLQNNPDGTVTLIPAEGQIIESGTPLTALNMNNLEKQYDEAKALVDALKIALNAENILWQGALYPTSAQTITPTKKLSECQRGWMLIWSDYDPGSPGTANNYQWVHTPIHKIQNALPGGNMLFNVPTSNSVNNYSANKELSITNTTITGVDTNDDASGTANDVCIRAVVEF
jgi:hypothetical protein